MSSGDGLAERARVTGSALMIRSAAMATSQTLADPRVKLMEIAERGFVLVDAAFWAT